VAHLPCHESGVSEVKLRTDFVMDHLETCTSNLSGGKNHYEKLNHEISVLQKVKYRLLVAIRRLWPICHVAKVVFQRSN
jgi:hypothetical protein